MKLQAEIKQKGPLLDGRAEGIIEKELLTAMYEATAFLEREVRERTPRGVYGAQGGLSATIHGEVSKGSSVIKGIVGIVGHQSRYGDVIEKGREPGKGMPPPGVLLRWIEVKLGVDERTAKSIEFVIRRKIGKKGFEGAHMFENALDENWDRVVGVFKERGFDIARKLNS